MSLPLQRPAAAKGTDDPNDHTHPELREVSIGIRATGMRRETDSTGETEVPADRYQGR